jgi:outer membrane receptor protein involved in Fe transport
MNSPRILALALLAFLLATVAPGPAAEETSSAAGDGADGVDGADAGTGDAAAAPEEESAHGAITSLTEALQGESGVSIQTMCTNCNSADLSMGGLGNDHIAMTCDGLPVPAGLAQVYLLSICPPTVIYNVEVEKGASSASFDGGAVGGEIGVERRPPAPGVDLSASADAGSFGWRGARFDLSGKAGWFGGNLLATIAQSDRINAPDGINPAEPAYDRYTVEGRAEFTPARDHFIVAGFGVYREEQQEGRAAYWREDERPEELEGIPLWNLENVDLSRDQVDLSYRGRFGDGSKVVVAALLADRSSDIEETLRGPEAIDDPRYANAGEFTPTYLIDDRQTAATASWSRPFGRRTVARAGLSVTESEFEVVDVRYNTQLITTELQSDPDLIRELFLRFLEEAGGDFELAQQLLNEYIEDLVMTSADSETVTEAGAWAEASVMLGSHVDLQVGVRYADFSYEEQVRYPTATADVWEALPLPEGSKWLPRGSLSWKPTDAVTFRLTAGQGYRQPAPTYNEVCCGRRYRGNRAIRMESSRAYGFETLFQPSSKFRLKGSIFRTDFEDLVVHLVGTYAADYAPTYQNTNIPEARITSYEAEASWEVNSWFDIKGSLVSTEAPNLTPEGEIPVLINDEQNRPQQRFLYSEDVPYVPKSTGTFGVAFHPRRWGLTFTIDALYKGEMLIQQWGQDEQFDRVVFGESQLRFVRTESFWVWSARATKTLPQGFTVYLGVDNFNDYVQPDLAVSGTDYTWAPLRGQYVYGGFGYQFAN